MKKTLVLLVGLLATTWTARAQQPISIIPKPKSLTVLNGYFTLSPQTKVVVPANSPDLASIARQLSDRLSVATGSRPEVASQSSGKDIVFELNTALPNEGYQLEVTPSKVTIAAAQPIGHFYGVQSLLQLFPTNVYGVAALNKNAVWQAPACRVIDEPRFSYRGGMLDVGRHFYSVDFIKKYIDLLALHKLNQFHWHLTEDQGWRIEIKKYPKLTEVGAWRKETVMQHDAPKGSKGDGKRYGGFYTQEQIRDIVKYAQERYVNIIPEIEMPGHALAALASYPELGCTGGPYEVGTGWGVYKDVYCPTEKTFGFLQDVLTEVMDLFPSTYIHIGGDECPKDSWKASAFAQNLMKKEGLKDEHELQSYFIRRIDKFITSKGRKMIGWDEILEGGISPNATIMSWRGMEGGIAAAQQGHDAIMTPTTNCYLDYYQGDPATEPKAIGGNLPLDRVYGFNPIPDELPAEKHKHILGTQGNLWTEYIDTPQKAEYMLFPRLTAIAEVAWTPQKNRNFEDFRNRLNTHFERLTQLGVNYSRSGNSIEAKTSLSGKGTPQIILTSRDPRGIVRYTVDGTTPTAASAIYDAKAGLPLAGNTSVSAAIFDSNGELISPILSRHYQLSKSTGRPYSLAHQPRVYLGNEDFALSNGIRGTQEHYQPWVGFEGKDLDITFDYGRRQLFSTVTAGFLNNPGDWVVTPRSIEVLVSDDGKTYRSVNKMELATEMPALKAVRQLNVALPANTNARYIRVVAKNFGPLPKGHAGEGRMPWLFVDEIGIE